MSDELMVGAADVDSFSAQDASLSADNPSSFSTDYGVDLSAGSSGIVDGSRVTNTFNDTAAVSTTPESVTGTTLSASSQPLDLSQTPKPLFSNVDLLPSLVATGKGSVTATATNAAAPTSVMTPVDNNAKGDATLNLGRPASGGVPATNATFAGFSDLDVNLGAAVTGTGTRAGTGTGGVTNGMPVVSKFEANGLDGGTAPVPVSLAQNSADGALALSAKQTASVSANSAVSRNTNPINPAEQVANNLLGKTPLSTGEQQLLSTTLGQSGALVASADQWKGFGQAPTSVDGSKNPLFKNFPAPTVNPGDNKPAVTPGQGLLAPVETVPIKNGELDPDTGRVKGVKPPTTTPVSPPGGAMTQQEKANLDNVLKIVLPGNSNWDKVNNPASNGTTQVNALTTELSKAEKQSLSQTNNNIRAIESKFNQVSTVSQDNKVAFDSLLGQRPVEIAVSKPLSDSIPKSGKTTTSVTSKTDGPGDGELKPSGISAAANSFATKLQNSDDLLNKLIDPTGAFRWGAATAINGVGGFLDSAENTLTGAANGGVTLESSVVSLANAPLTVLDTANTIFGNNQDVKGALDSAGQAVSKSLNPGASDAETLFTAGASKLGGDWLINKGATKTFEAVAPVVGGTLNKVFKSTENASTRPAGGSPSGVTQYNTAAMPGGDDAMRTTSWSELSNVRGAGTGGTSAGGSSVSGSAAPEFIQSPAVNPNVTRRILGEPPVTPEQQYQAIDQLLNYDRRTKLMPGNTVDSYATSVNRQIQMSLEPDPANFTPTATSPTPQHIARQRYNELGYDQLTTAETASLRAWIASDYEAMKSAVTNPFDLTKTFSTAGAGDGNAARTVAQATSVFDSALAKLPSVEGTFYKGINLNDVEMRKFLPGANIELTQYTAASAVRPLSAFNQRNTQFVIKVGEGDIAAPNTRSAMSVAQEIEHTPASQSGSGPRSLIHANPGEAEVLFERNSRFKVLSVTPTTTRQGQPLTIIEMKQIRR